MEYDIQESPTRTAHLGHSDVPGFASGNWSPSLGGTSSASNEGYWIKIGPVVYVGCSLNITTLGTGNANTVSGLPFPVAARTSAAGIGAVWYTNLALSVVEVVALANTSQTTVNLQSMTIAGSSLGSNNILTDGSQIRFNLFYFTDA